MNGYIALYNGKRIEVTAETSYEAYVKAVEQLKPPKSKAHMVHVVLAEKNGKPVVHSTSSL